MPSFHPNVRPGLPKNISTHLLAVAGSRSERTAKWNRLLRIEAELGADADYAGRAPFAPLSKA